MKVRVGFVSNSSTSSFVCDICGADAVGMDIGLEEADMYECENGHTFCRSEALEDVAEEDDSDYGSSIPEKYCPICNFLEVSNRDIGRYLEKTSKITRDEIFAEVKKVNKRRKKLYDNEYVEAVCLRIGTTSSDVIKELKEKFKEYKEFLKFLREKT